MNQSTPKAECERHVIERMTVRLHTDGMNGGTEFDALVARGVSVEVVYTRTESVIEDGIEVVKPGVKIAAIRTSGPAWFDSDSGAVLSFTVGTCLMKMMNEHDIEALEDEIYKKVGP